MPEPSDGLATITSIGTRPIVFVGGPIQAALGPAGFDPTLRDVLEALLMDLTDVGYRVLSAHRAEQFGEAAECFTPQLVTGRDHAWMRQADVYVALLPLDDHARPVDSAGTGIELGWAAAYGIPVVVVWHSEEPERYSHLVRGLSVVATVRYFDLLKCRTSRSGLLSVIAHLLP